MKTEKTCRQLYNEFTDRYTVNEIENNRELATLFTYLQHRCSMNNGNYYHEPKPEIADLLVKFLHYSPNAEKPKVISNMQQVYMLFQVSPIKQKGPALANESDPFPYNEAKVSFC